MKLSPTGEFTTLELPRAELLHQLPDIVERFLKQEEAELSGADIRDIIIKTLRAAQDLKADQAGFMSKLEDKQSTLAAELLTIAQDEKLKGNKKKLED